MLSFEFPEELNLNDEVAPTALDVQLILMLAAGQASTPDKDIAIT
ncbi:hypothetical protein [Bradyrhizobium sp. AUGA SZCCT0160]|nr:hypothetical protein [Bradyrhizobium sp. AUGA SZCCT0160]